MSRLAECISWNGLLAKNFTALSDEEITLVLEWRNHPQVRRWMHNTDLIVLDAHIRFIEKLKTDSNNVYWLINDSAAAMQLGVIYINRIDWTEKTGSFGVYRNPYLDLAGAGRRLAEFEIEIAFNKLFLNTLLLDVQQENRIAIGLYQKLGFVTIENLDGFVWMKLSKNE